MQSVVVAAFVRVANPRSGAVLSTPRPYKSRAPAVKRSRTLHAKNRTMITVMNRRARSTGDTQAWSPG
jgi:hypothetical protein